MTPDIQAGDEATISFAGEAAGDTTVQDAYVTGVNYTPGQTTFTVVGKVAEGINRSQMEQRIVNPDLTDTAVGRRDVRAVPGGLVRAERGGYSSNLEFSGDSFTATYVFDDPEVARIAATGGGERIMAWQEQDVDENRQGLTISEHGELGGPGMSGCPAGPSEQSAPRPGTAAVVRSEDKSSLQVTWTPATAQPGSAPSAATASSRSRRTSRRSAAVAGRRPHGRALDPHHDRRPRSGRGYTVEVRSLAGARMSEAFAIQVPGGTPDAPTGDLAAPVITATPQPVDGIAAKTKTVTLVANEDVDIYYTTDGSGVLANGDLPSDTALLYTGPIAITQETILKYVAFDRAGNVTEGEGRFVPADPDPLPAAPLAGASTAGEGTLTLRWSSTDPTVTGFAVQLYDADALPSARRARRPPRP